MSRRQFGRTGADYIVAGIPIAASLGVAGAFGTEAAKQHDRKQASSATQTALADLGVGGQVGAIETAEARIGPPIFEDPDAQEAADQLGLAPGDFLYVRDELPDSYEAYKSDRLFPVFHPRVMQQKELIYNLAREHSVPPNIIATLMSIESGGNPRPPVHGENEITGLFQVSATLHMQDENSDDYDNPEINGKHAMLVLRDSIRSAKEFLGDTNLEDVSPYDERPDVYLRAFAMYNAGPTGAWKDFDDQELPLEAHQYIQHTNRFFKVFEIAHKLREKGFDDVQIAEKLISDEVDARAEAFREFGTSFPTPDDALKYLSKDTIELPKVADYATQTSEQDAEEALFHVYMDFKHGNLEYEYDLNPAVRMHTATAAGFVTEDPVNKIVDNWFSPEIMNTHPLD